MDDEWISAADAYDLVRRVNPHAAADSICSRAHDGLVTASARLLIVGEKRSEEEEVPAGFWWARGHEALDQNWSSGDFETWIDRRVHCRAYGVTFLKRDIDAMLPPIRSRHDNPKFAPQGNYADAWRSVTELQKQVGGTTSDVTDQIVRFCRAGLIDARCSSFWREVTGPVGSEEEEFEEVAIPTWFWEQGVSGPETILDWRTGTFAGRGLVDGKTHKVRIKGVQFNISGLVDLENLLRTQETGDDPVSVSSESAIKGDQPQTQTRTGRPKSENWTNWIAELATYIHEIGIPAGSGSEGQDPLIAAIEERLLSRNLESPGRTTVQPAVRAVLLRLRAAGK